MKRRGTQCRNGHPLSGDNLWVDGKGRRICKTCSKASYRDYMERRNREAGGRCEMCGVPTTLQKDRKTPHRLCKPCSDLFKLGAHTHKGDENAHWVGDAARPQTGRKRAAQMYEATECQECGAMERVERHHVDGNTANNVPENIAILCRRCHARAHRSVA